MFTVFFHSFSRFILRYFSSAVRNIRNDTVSVVIVIIISNYALQPLRLIVRSGLDVPTFATRRLHARHEGKTVGEKCPVILPKWRFPRYI